MTDLVDSFELNFNEIDGITEEAMTEELEAAAARVGQSGGGFIRKAGTYVLELIDIVDMKRSERDPNWAQCKMVFQDEEGKRFTENWCPIPQAGTLTYATASGKAQDCAYKQLTKILYGLGYKGLSIETPVKITEKMSAEEKKKALALKAKLKKDAVTALKTALREVFSGEAAIGTKVVANLKFEGYHIEKGEDGNYLLLDKAGKQHPQTKIKTFQSEDAVKQWMTKKKLVKSFKNKEGDMEERADLASLSAVSYTPYNLEDTNKQEDEQETAEREKPPKTEKVEKPAKKKQEKKEEVVEEPEIPSMDALVSTEDEADDDEFFKD